MARTTSSGIFPLTITFKKDNFEKFFKNREELEQWRVAEQQFWSAYGSGGDNVGQAINRNMQQLNSIAPTDDQTTSSRLGGFSDNYLPSEAGFSKAVERLRAFDANAARLAVWIFLSPQNAQWQNNREFVQAVSLIAAYHALGDPKGSREVIESALSDIKKIKDAEIIRSEEFSNLYDKVDEEFKTRFDGYEAKMALAAPRHYWSTRARLHRRLEASARRRWSRWTAAVVILFAFGAAVTFTGVGEWINGLIDGSLGVQPATPAQSEPLVVLASLLKRVVVLGGLLGIGVWWLRQLLRELRSHEHLAEDAAERVTMIETYAALRAAGLGDGDLAPILTALYRAAATGLVVDDGGGPILPWEALVKAAVTKGREG